MRKVLKIMRHLESFLAAALAACSSSQYHVLVVLVLVVLVVVPELLSEFQFFWFLRVP